MDQTHPTNHGFLFSYVPTPIYKIRQPTMNIIKANHITSRAKQISASIHYLRDQYALLTIDPVKLKTTIQAAYVCTKIFTGPLFECHYSYIRVTNYYPSPDSYHYSRLSIETLCIPYLPTATSKYI